MVGTELLRASPQPVAYTMMWNFMSSYGRKRGGMYQQSGHMGYPGDCIFVFDPEFVTFCDEYAKRLAATKDDPWLVGHFSDNELPFYTKSLDNFLNSLRETQVEQPWIAGSRIVACGIRRSRGLPTRCDRSFSVLWRSAICRSQRRRFADMIRIIFCLGPRFDFQALQSKPLFEGPAGRHLDVIAVNYYHAWSPDPVRIGNWVQWSGKPFLVTEWYAKGMDSGFGNTTGAGW